MDECIETSISEICRILKGIGKHAVTNNKLDDCYTKWWTEKIYRCIGAKGKAQGFEVYSEQHDCEWRYDLCWVEREDWNIKEDWAGRTHWNNRKTKITKRLPLVLECEWSRDKQKDPDRPEFDKIEYDFEKLLWSPAELRVMIFDARWKNISGGKARERAKKKIEELKKRVRAFSGDQPDGIYLFCAWCHDKRDTCFHFDPWEIGTDHD